MNNYKICNVMKLLVLSDIVQVINFIMTQTKRASKSPYLPVNVIVNGRLSVCVKPVIVISSLSRLYPTSRPKSARIGSRSPCATH